MGEKQPRWGCGGTSCRPVERTGPSGSRVLRGVSRPVMAGGDEGRPFVGSGRRPNRQAQTWAATAGARPDARAAGTQPHAGMG